MISQVTSRNSFMNKCWTWIHPFLAICLVLIARHFNGCWSLYPCFTDCKHVSAISLHSGFKSQGVDVVVFFFFFFFFFWSSNLCMYISTVSCMQTNVRKSFIYFLPKTEPEKQINKHQKGTSWPQLHYTETPVQQKLNNSTLFYRIHKNKRWNVTVCGQFEPVPAWHIWP